MVMVMVVKHVQSKNSIKRGTFFPDTLYIDIARDVYYPIRTGLFQTLPGTGEGSLLPAGHNSQ